ncbi:MAG TPA: DUF1846 domain-containing protein [Acidobacteriota bacterium]
MISSGFDNALYLEKQSRAILDRVERFENKLYLEFGGKLLYDFHAARVLPGFDPNVKMHLLHKLKDKAEILLCIYAGDIERKKIRADFGITYDADALKLIDELGEWGLTMRAVVVTRYENQPAAKVFKNRLERRGIPVFTHPFTKGYPTDIDLIVGDEGYGANDYISTAKPLVVVTGPGPGSGKLATCLSQLYHEWKRGVKAGFAKFETFPIWNLPLKHPVNVAYEAATADLADFNLVDPFHLEAYGRAAVNYNRDVEVFPVLKRILERITGGGSFYQSPTDMGVNAAGLAISDDAAVRRAALQELIRRYFRYLCEYAMGLTEKDTVQRAELLMKELNVRPEDRPVVVPAREAVEDAQRRGKGNEGIFVGAAIALGDGTIVTGSNSPLMHAASSLVLNAVKKLAGIPPSLPLLTASIIESVAALKKNILGAKTVNLDLSEVLICLSLNAPANPMAQLALEKLKELHGCEAHTTHLPAPGDEAGLRRLGINLTSEPNFSDKTLYIT